MPEAWNDVQKIDYAGLEAAKESFHKLTLTKYDAGIAEVDEQLEAQLFHSRQTRAGEALSALSLDVTMESPERILPVEDFSKAPLHPVVLENIDKCGYTKPTAIQGYCIPATLAGKDVVAVAQTGSGKTAAYLIPIVSSLIGKVDQIGGPRANTRALDYNPDIHKVRAEPLVLIICPTRELALQIYEETRRISYRSKMRAACAYGGIPVKYNLQQLGKGCDILIGTPGRLMDMLERHDVLSLQRVKFTVIDEADEMLQDTEWQEALTRIMAGGDANEDADSRYLMFSATFPKAARNLARQYLQEDYVRIRVGRAGSTHKNVKQEIIWTDRDAKQEAIYDLLTKMDPDLTIIFCNSIAQVERLDDYLFNKGLPVTFLHGKRSQFEREDSLRSFYNAKHPILITTAVAARGIDFPNVGTVINFDMPSVDHGGISEYVHRIGRTGRIGHIGTAISFYNERDEGLAQDLVNVLMETDQEVPDFLAQFKPEDGKVEFNDDSADEDDAAGDAGGDGWGGNASSSGAAPSGGDGWGADDSAGGASDNKAEEPKQAAWGSGGDDTASGAAGW